MKKLFDFVNRKIYDVIVINVLLLSAILMLSRHKASLIRLIYAFIDFAISIAYYFCSFFDKTIPVTVTRLPSLSVLQYLPYDVDEIIRKLSDMWQYVFDPECFLSFFISGIAAINSASMMIILLLPLLLLLPFLVKKILLYPNESAHNSKSRLVLFFENKAMDKLYDAKDRFLTLFSTLWESSLYRWIFIILWLINFNLLTIALEFLAFYFYFAFSFDLANVPVQLVKLLLDLIIMFSSAPVVFWIVISYLIIRVIRKKIGFTRLNYRENLDRSFIERQPLIMMFTGSMGTGKTTALTSFLISIEIRFRNKALELMLELDARYPNFPWINLEDSLREAIANGTVKNLTTCRDFIKSLEEIFIESEDPADIFDYDVDHYRYSFDDNLSYKDIWETLSDYACLYFIYIIQSSLIVSNYSVRVDNEFCDSGNFPLWDTELFKNSPQASAERSRRAHVLDYDVLRLGRQVLAENPRRNSFEFGVVGLSEFAKERGNQVTLQDVKKGDDRTNQKNDLFAYGLKMCRHKATICGFPFITFVADEQRPDSLNADTRDLLSIINIDEKKPTELLMPLYFIEELIHDLLYPKWNEFYTHYRYNRGDVCFPVYVCHNIMAAIHNGYKKAYNLFGCNELEISVQSGKMDSEPVKDHIHLLHKKVYSDRFATDCHNGFFVPGLRETKSSFDEYLEYSDTVASIEELLYQNSYFIADMEKINLKGDKNE